MIEDRSLPAAHDGSIKDYALSDDRRLLATAGADGFVRVWDVVDRTIVHEIPIGDTQVQGVVFVDRNTLAVLPQPGTLRLVTIDTGNLLQIVRQSLTRGFTPTECGKFAFADDCPTLADVRGRSYARRARRGTRARGRDRSP